LSQHPAVSNDLDTATHVQTTIGVPELDPFFDRGLITRIHAKLMSGKEATVYCCRAHPATRRRFLAAKVYRKHAASAHKWAPEYFQGRERVLKERTIRAIRAHSAFGKTVAAGLWVDAEYSNLCRLASAGASTPVPVARAGRAILMEFVGNGAGPAPHLDGVSLDRASAERLWGQIFGDVKLMLREHLVHGDLSPFNILVWDGDARIIDLPQAVDARFNNAAPRLLERDLRNLATFFGRSGLEVDVPRTFVDLWTRYQRGEL